LAAPPQKKNDYSENIIFALISTASISLFVKRYKTTEGRHKKNAPSRTLSSLLNFYDFIILIQQEGRELQNSFCSAENRQPSVAEEMVR
jgi:hypothetical protein